MRRVLLLLLVVSASGCSACEAETSSAPITPVIEAEPTPPEPAALNVLPHCAEAEREAAAVLAQADAWVAGYSAGVESWARATAPMRTCSGVSTEAGAWIFLPVEAQIEERSGYDVFGQAVSAAVFDIAYDLVFIDAGGTRHVHERRHQLADYLQSLETRTGIVTALDFDGDGAPELVWRAVESQMEDSSSSYAFLTYREGEIRSYAPVEGIEVESFADYDEDGRIDIVTTRRYWPEEIYGSGMSDRVEGAPPVLFHSAADGSFTASDAVAARYLRAQCPSPPTRIIGEGAQWEGDAELAVACARLWGASAADVRTQILRESQGIPASERDLEFTLRILQEHANVEPPVQLGP